MSVSTTTTTRQFHTQTSENNPAREEVMRALGEIKDEKGKNFHELGMLHTLEIKDGTINIKLNLTSDYRKVKTLV
jgi:metal-sulfur cluster biosynthetic enzyme